MDYRHPGRTGLKVSEICPGTMTCAGQCDGPTSWRILDIAADHGALVLCNAVWWDLPRRPAGR